MPNAAGDSGFPDLAFRSKLCALCGPPHPLRSMGNRRQSPTPILSNPVEEPYFSNPNSTDSDGDGIDDDVEVNTYGSDPDHTDTDGDGVPDATELSWGTSITNPDTDGDGLPDGVDPNPTSAGFTTSAASALEVWAPQE